MIICHCRGITDREVREAAHRGARTAREIGLRCQAGTDCGGCAALIEELLKIRLAARTSDEAGVANPRP